MRSRAEASPSFVFAPGLGEPGSSVTLSETESHYLARVCRARAGDRVTATDGRGRIGHLHLTSVHGRVKALVERCEVLERRRRAWVWCGAPEGARADWLVEKLAELGVERWQPLQCRRGDWRGGRGRVTRWERLAVAGMRQSQRSFLMEVAEPIGVEAALEQIPLSSSRWVASRSGPRGGAGSGARADLAVGAIGPASGFTATEEAALKAAEFRPIGLSEGRLRTETAALAWALWWSVS